MTEHPAVFTAHTVQGPVHVCVGHAQKLEHVMRAMGVRVTFTAAPDEAQCSNCEHEAKRATAQAGGRNV